MGMVEVKRFLTHLAALRDVSASTQNQALSAILFLYKEVLNQQLGWLDGFERAKRPARLPVVLSPAEVRAVLAHMDGVMRLMASLLYGAGLRLMECVRLRVKDVDLDYRLVVVRDGMGHKDRVTMLPEAAVEPLRQHLAKMKVLHEKYMSAGFGEVYLPFALERKYPNANPTRGWHS